MPVTKVSANWTDSAGNLTLKGAGKIILKQTGGLEFGVDGTGVDLKLFGDTASAYWLWDQSGNETVYAGAARLNFSSAAPAAANTDGGLIKAGTSASKVTTATANMKFLSFYLENTATSGDNRAMYLRLYLGGAGGGGEAARIFTTVNNVAAGTAHGAHISLNFGATGTVTGQGIAMRGTLHCPDGNLAGTTAAVQAEIYADGSSSNNTGTMSHIRIITDGDATGVAALEDVNFIEFDGMANPGSGKYIDTDITTHTAYAGIKIKMSDGVTKYIPLVND